MTKRSTAIILTALAVCAIMVSMCLICDIEIGSYRYPTYLLQAKAWLRGDVYLDRNYEYLELAVYEDNYYVSFPPVPSVPMVLWALIFGDDVPGGLFQKIYVLIACLLVLSELMRTKRMPVKDCIAWSILLCLGSSLLPIQMIGAVWYEAQIMAFLFCIAAIVALRRQKIVPTCLCYALAVGCRPFSALLGPVLLMMYLEDSRGLPVSAKIRKLLPGLAVGLCVAAAYGAYNYARFGNPFEFGHNYLPEFTRAEHGQLSLVYLWDNLKAFLFGAPYRAEDGVIYINQFGFSLFISCPVFICSVIWMVKDIFLRRFSPAKAVIVLMGAANVVLLCMHRTLGGHQFGARYALEMIPLVFCYLLLSCDKKHMTRWESSLLGFGLILNYVGGCLVHL